MAVFVKSQRNNMVFFVKNQRNNGIKMTSTENVCHFFYYKSPNFHSPIVRFSESKLMPTLTMGSPHWLNFAA